ncbi:acyl-CoA dehydrogenase/oxidase [Cladochytrium replicatum]|nr:acyl-CoA dehydrogenase/oxidase [Cladochytrium replicatum]
MSKQFTVQEVATHNKESDAWVIIDGEVFNVTDFAAMHPGGELLLLQYAGKDVTEEFYGLHRQEVLDKYRKKLKIGDIAGATRKVLQTGGVVSKVPYAEPSFFQGFKSPYYNDSHAKFRAAVRKFYHEEIYEEAKSLETLEKVPPVELYQKLGAAGILAARLGPGAHLKGFPQLGGIDPANFDYFHELIAHQEHGRMGLPGIADGLGAGHVIGLPPIMNFGPAWMKEKVMPEVLRGDKRICLAITEPTAGSDVAGLLTSAKKTPDGKFFIVNGVKKWITNGVFADYFTTAVRTEKGISVLLIPRTEGVSTKLIRTSYSPAAGTSLVIFENVKVPVENLIGTEGHGFQVIMFNFNHERWAIVASVVSGARLVVEESLKWAHQRKVFGKRLIDQPVIRFKLANMIAQVEAVENWLENITFQMTKMSYKEQSAKLAGPIALLKLQSTRVAGYVADESCQILGGRAITKTGMGSVIESWQRSYKFGAILGGSEEIMADLGVRQLMKDFPNAKL